MHRLEKKVKQTTVCDVQFKSINLQTVLKKVNGLRYIDFPEKKLPGVSEYDKPQEEEDWDMMDTQPYKEEEGEDVCGLR